MRLRHIEVFQAIRLTGSVSRAAEILRISQPAVSKTLQHMEMQLGFSLFERVKGRLQLTHEAELLGPEVEKVFRELENVRRLARNLRQHPEGLLRLGCVPSLGLSLLPQAIAMSRASQPGVMIDLQTGHTSGLIASLLAREIDIAIVFNPSHHPGIRSVLLGESELVCLSTDPDTSPLMLDSLTTQSQIRLPQDDPLGGLLPFLDNGEEQPSDSAIKVQTYYVACALAQAGCGYAIVDALTAQAMLKPGCFIRPVRPRIPFKLAALVHESNTLSQLDHGFIELLQTLGSQTPFAEPPPN
ncbi:LysR family transcriptional regulator [Pseudomonas sp. PB120]|uniref:LysR family transcriptional regulator n=1 Tax=Pseudomonas sp. PB120 TaxID=2494700 RepID=UPI0012FE0B85|nr:LysR family transcriptional regulator [Pseudomonas sp. PB120]MVV47543.1 LysR family transcriptional regulator [Pseudomonas sp. PB120]